MSGSPNVAGAAPSPPAESPPEERVVSALPSPEDAGLAELAAQYDLLAELGRGGSAVVYRARDRQLGREVALKAVRLAPTLSARERALEVTRLAREARTTARLTHPHIVTVYAVHELRDGLAVAMQYVPGRSLKQLLADEGPMAPAPAVRLLGEVAAALAYAHAHGVVHRDVKPENIFLDAESGRALLADFGAARAGDADVRVTRTGATVGTPAYMAPEQIDGGPLDGRADLYSLGLVAWEALTGRRPWEGAGLYQLLHHQKHDTLPPIAAVRPASVAPVPLTVEYVIARLLQKRPGARWASAEVVASQLERPVLPADYKLWAREHRRHMAEAAARGIAPRAAAVSAESRTERFTPGHAATAAADAAETTGQPLGAVVAADDESAPGDDAPSWTRPRGSANRRWLVGAVAAAALLAAGVPAAARMRASSPERVATLADRGSQSGNAGGVNDERMSDAGADAASPDAVAPSVEQSRATAPASTTRSDSAGGVLELAPAGTVTAAGDTARRVTVPIPPAVPPAAPPRLAAAPTGRAVAAPGGTLPPPSLAASSPTPLPSVVTLTPRLPMLRRQSDETPAVRA
jgi:serine/threonine protein kinase